MVNPKLADADQFSELHRYLLAKKIPRAEMEAFLKRLRDGSGGGVQKDTPVQVLPYRVRFRRAIRACACKRNDPKLTSKEFEENVFGELGKGYVLMQPPKSKEVQGRGHWLDSDIKAWLFGKNIAGKKLEPCSLIDLTKYGEVHPDEQRTKMIICCRPSKNGRVACLGMRGSARHFYAHKCEGSWSFVCWFLLRTVRQKPKGAQRTARRRS